MIKRIISLVLSSILLLSLFSCGNEVVEEETPSEYYTADFFAMDTDVTVKLARDTGNTEEGKTLYHDDAHLSQIAKECADIAANIEAKISRTKEDSVIAELNAEGDYFLDIDPEVQEIIYKSLGISDLTDGAYDITIGTLTELWNITGVGPIVPSDEKIDEAKSHVGYKKIKMDDANFRKEDRKTKLDLGAIGKGYALGKIIEYLKTTDITYGLVSFGGNVGVFGDKPETGTFKVGITDAKETSKVSSYVFIDHEYVSVSGDYERFFITNGVKYSHIFDPATGRPADTDITSVAVICEDPDIGDALSTALFVKGSAGTLEFYEKLKSLDTTIWNFEAVIQTKDGDLIITDGLKNSSRFEKYVEPVTTETGENAGK